MAHEQEEEEGSVIFIYCNVSGFTSHCCASGSLFILWKVPQLGPQLWGFIRLWSWEPPSILQLGGAYTRWSLDHPSL